MNGPGWVPAQRRGGTPSALIFPIGVARTMAVVAAVAALVVALIMAAPADPPARECVYDQAQYQLCEEGP
jgi:hypothetical protein